MNILAIECSCSHASLCLSKAGAVQLSRSWVAGRNHDEHLFPALREALELLGDAPLELILVGSGPGSYGGVRVALAAASGVALVRGSRVVALCSWDQLSAEGASILSDAKRGGWALRSPQGQLDVLDTQEVQHALASGACIWSVEPQHVLDRAGLAVTRCGLIPTAEGLLSSWLAMSEEEQEACAAQPAEPIYVRPPHITAPKHKPWEIPN